MSKHNLVTLIYDPATGISEEIECPYVFVNSLFDYSYYAYDKEFDDVTTEAAQAILYGLEIVDGYLSTSAVESGRTVAVNAEHAFVDVAEINGEPITDFYMIGKNKWSVRTLNYEYLVDGTGTIIGEMSNASVNYDLFYNGEPIYDEEGANAGFNYSGMIFDSNLSLIYNAPSEKRSVVNVLEGTFLLKNYDGEIFCFDGSNSKKIISKKNVEDCSYFVLDSSLIVVVDATDEEDINIEFYNAKGEKIFTTDFESVSDMEESVISSESAVLVPYVDADGNRAFYRFN